MISFLIRKKPLLNNLIHKSIAFIVPLIMLATFPTQFVSAVSITDSKSDKVLTGYTLHKEKKAILNEANVQVSNEDDITLNSSSTSSTIEVNINRSLNVTVTTADDTKEMVFKSGTVEDALRECGIEPTENDLVNYSLDTPLENEMVISYNKVEIIEKVRKAKIPNKVIVKENNELKSNEKRVIKKGCKGIREIKTTTTKVDGIVNSVVNQNSITKKPQTRVIEMGKPDCADPKKWVSTMRPKNAIKVDENGKPLNYSKKLTGIASAYCTGTTCSTGMSVRPGCVAVDPSIIPYGSELYICTPDGSFTYGYAVAADTGGFTSWGNTLADLYMSSYDECISFGRQPIEMYILK